MLALLFLLPPLRRAGHVSAYAFLEDRLGPGARRLASACFQIFRGIATGVTVYGVALVVTLLVDVTYTQAVLLLMGITILYDVLGGMRAVVISDVLQLALIAGAVVLSLFMLGDSGAVVAPERLNALQFSWGLQDSGNYGFWPMLLRRLLRLRPEPSAAGVGSPFRTSCQPSAAAQRPAAVSAGCALLPAWLGLGGLC